MVKLSNNNESYFFKGKLLCFIWTAGSLLFFFANLLHEKPKHASGEAVSRDKRGRKPEKKK